MVRLPLLQAAQDRVAGLNTAGYITGYRGSPLGGYDLQLWQAQELLEKENIVFQPGINEDLAATAIWGTQQAEIGGRGKFDGVFCIWYGKGPGVDRSGDAMRHANLAGTSRFGGVLAALGDDHACESSTTAHQSEYALVNTMIPVLNPSGVQDILDFGLAGWALSRYSGCWIGLKCVHDTVEATATIDIDLTRSKTVMPENFQIPAGGLNIRWPDTPLEQEARLHEYKLPAVHAFWAANSFDRIIYDSSDAVMGIVTTGKSYSDVRRALKELDIDEQQARKFGIRLYKVAMSWPLEPEGLHRFASGLKKIIVVEEKRGLMEEQIKALLYGQSDAPVVIGKRDETGAVLLPAQARLNAMQIASVLGQQLGLFVDSESLRSRVDSVRQRLQQEIEPPHMQRIPYFLCRMSSQYFNQSTGRKYCTGGNRMSLHGAVDGSIHGEIYTDGRRRCRLDRGKPFQHDQSCISEYWRRHLFAFGIARGSCRGCSKCQYDFQASVQRCRCNDLVVSHSTGHSARLKWRDNCWPKGSDRCISLPMNPKSTVTREAI